MALKVDMPLNKEINLKIMEDENCNVKVKDETEKEITNLISKINIEKLLANRFF